MPSTSDDSGAPGRIGVRPRRPNAVTGVWVLIISGGGAAIADEQSRAAVEVFTKP